MSVLNALLTGAPLPTSSTSSDAHATQEYRRQQPPPLPSLSASPQRTAQPGLVMSVADPMTDAETHHRVTTSAAAVSPVAAARTPGSTMPSALRHHEQQQQHHQQHQQEEEMMHPSHWYNTTSTAPAEANLMLALQEIKANARQAEDTLWALQTQLKEKTIEAERLRHQLRLNDAEERQRRQREEAAAAAAAKGEVHVSTDGMTQEEFFQLRRLQEKLKSLGEAVDSAHEEKLRLLKVIDRHVHGGAAPTLADQPLFGAASRNPQSQALANMLRALPQRNVDALQRVKFFAFAKLALAAGARSHNRFGSVNVETAALDGVHRVGDNIRLAQVITEMDEDDLLKL